MAGGHLSEREAVRFFQAKNTASGPPPVSSPADCLGGSSWPEVAHDEREVP